MPFNRTASAAPQPHTCLRLLWLLSLLARLLPLAAATLTAEADEAATMHDLRRRLHQEIPPWSLRAQGWNPADPASHCTWLGVTCKNQRIRSLTLMYEHQDGKAANASSAQPGWAPPEVGQLARLQLLERLDIMWPGRSWGRVLPQEWLQLGAFPSLHRLLLRIDTVPGAAPLPDMPPGALSALRLFILEAFTFVSTLPASWGSDPAVLPSLEELSVAAFVQGGVPPEWWKGFRELNTLVISDMADREPDPKAAQAGAAAPRLPNEWAQGFPKLQSVLLGGLGLTGSLPNAWRNPASFPALKDLRLHDNALTGTLPPALFSEFPHLKLLNVNNNQFSGTVPPEWGTCKAWSISLERNALTGPAFPAAWANGSMPNMKYYAVGHTLVTGTLPPTLPWPRLSNLMVEGTQMHGTVPSSWCEAPFSLTLRNLYIGDTRIEPAMPKCTEPHLVNFNVLATDPRVGIQVLGPNNTVPALEKGRGAAMAVGLGTALPLCAMIAAGFAGRVILRRRRRQVLRDALERQRLVWNEGYPWHWRQRGATQHARQQSGWSQEDGSSMGLEVEAASGTSQPAGFGPGGPSPSSIVRPAQRGRLAALLSTRVGASGARLEMVQVGAVPASLAHRLVTPSHRTGQGGVPAPHLLAPHQQGHIPHDPGDPAPAPLLELCSLFPTPNPQSMAALQEWVPGTSCAGPPPAEPATCCSAGSGPSAADNYSSGGLASRPDGPPSAWRLPTQSLRMPASAIMFISDNRGELIELGSGNHAIVFLGKLQPEGKLVAVKVFELEAGVDRGAVWREVAMMRRCRHPRVVQLMGVMLKGPLLMLALELLPKGSIKATLTDASLKSELRWTARGRQVALDMAEGLDHLHTQLGIMHSDLKPANVLLSADWRACLADLGLAQMMGSNCRTAAGLTRVYAAPEQLMGQRCGLSADMYSFGLLLVSLLTQQLVEARGSWRLPRAPDECPQDVAALIQECLSADPVQRPTAEQALARLRACSTAAG